MMHPRNNLNAHTAKSFNEIYHKRVLVERSIEHDRDKKFQ